MVRGYAAGNKPKFHKILFFSKKCTMYFIVRKTRSGGNKKKDKNNLLFLETYTMKRGRYRGKTMIIIFIS